MTATEEIYEICVIKEDEEEPEITADYESNIITKLIDDYDMDPDTSWFDFCDENNILVNIYPFYIEDSIETISVNLLTPDAHVGERPLMVEGMHRHTIEQLEQLRVVDENGDSKIYSLEELGRIEHWTIDPPRES